MAQGECSRPGPARAANAGMTRSSANFSRASPENVGPNFYDYPHGVFVAH